MSYSPTLGRFFQRDPLGYVDGMGLYQYEQGNSLKRLDAMGLAGAAMSPMAGVAMSPLAGPTTGVTPGPGTSRDRERGLWERQQQLAFQALSFWADFLRLQMGDGSAMSDQCKANFFALIRAMSWVESRHGTAGANQPGRDPMQSGNPRDQWWAGLTGPGQSDRIVGGPGRGNWWLNQLPGAAGIAAPPLGHDDPSFGPPLSYYWGVLGLIQKTNAKGGGKTFRCGDCSMENLINGAVGYNGGGDPMYRQKLLEALRMMGLV